ncbi:unnamed protein product, partial [marine sediment metagenome]
DYEITGCNAFKTFIKQFAFITDSSGKYTYTQNVSKHEIVVEAEITGAIGTISGTVRDVETTDTIEGASVQAKQGGITRGGDTTDSSGIYSIDIVTGTYDVTVTTIGYESSTQTNQEVLEAQTTTVNFDLVPYGDTTPPSDIATVNDNPERVTPVTVPLLVEVQPTTPVLPGESPIAYQYFDIPLSSSAEG